jgi:uracil-DNA glycosylase
MAEPMTAAPFLPGRRNLKALALAARSCRGCPLWRDATQTVFGEGLKRSRLMMVGEQPGNEEDLQGRPFLRAPDDATRRRERERFTEDLARVREWLG